MLDEIVGKNQRYEKAAIRASKSCFNFDDCRTGAPENFQENPLLKTGYFFYRHTSEIGSFRSLTNLTPGTRDISCRVNLR